MRKYFNYFLSVTKKEASSPTDTRVGSVSYLFDVNLYLMDLGSYLGILMSNMFNMVFSSCI